MRQLAVDSSRLRSYTSSLEKRRAKANKSIEQATKELSRVAELSINSIRQHQASVTELLTREKSNYDDAFSKQLSKLTKKIQGMDNLSALSSDVLQRNDLKEMLNISQVFDEKIAEEETPLLNCPEFKYTPNDALSAPGTLYITNTEPSLSVASGEGLTKGTIGEESSFTVFTKNSSGQTIYSEIDNVNVEIKSKQEGIADIRSVIKDLKDGRYSISYRPSVAGEFSVSIKVREEPINESPFKLMVTKKTAINDFWPPSTRSTKQVIKNAAIQLLSQGHFRRIHTLEQRYDVSISVEKAVGRIIVRGQSGDILDVVGEIHKILHQLREEEHERKRAEALSKDIQWMYEDLIDFLHYESHVNVMIEIAYHEKKPTVTITSDDGHDYEINFKKMTETDEHGNVIKVRRNDLRKGVQLPNHWTPQPKDPQGIKKTAHLFQLDPSRDVQEYQDVQSRFQRTCGLQIVKIERVQNPVLYGTYAIRKQQMDHAKGSNEQLLFHGTPGHNCQLINHTGFNRSFHGKNATMYGNGVYFTSDSSYSARSTYSPPDVAGFRYMYLTRVLVGEYTVGRWGLITPPAKNPNDPTDTYDSVVDQIPNPGIFVVFHDWQCYPEYLITFQ